jgi:hypothetical protein
MDALLRSTEAVLTRGQFAAIAKLAGALRQRHRPLRLRAPDGAGEPDWQIEADSLIGRYVPGRLENTEANAHAPGPVDVDLAACPDGATVSALHARLLRRDGLWCVRDLDSKNGTALNDNALAPGEVRALAPGDRLCLGLVCLTVLPDDRTPGEAPHAA